MQDAARADAEASQEIEATFNAKQREFLDFVLSQYDGVDELEPETLCVPSLKYCAIADAMAELGGPEKIRGAFGSSKYIFMRSSSKSWTGEGGAADLRMNSPLGVDYL